MSNIDLKHLEQSAAVFVTGNRARIERLLSDTTRRPEFLAWVGSDPIQWHGQAMPDDIDHVTVSLDRTQCLEENLADCEQQLIHAMRLRCDPDFFEAEMDRINKTLMEDPAYFD